MKDFIMKTNFGHTYKISREVVAKDYAATAIQWQDDEDVETPKTEDEIYQEIIGHYVNLESWYCDQIAGDVVYAMTCGELISVDEEVYKDFIDYMIRQFGSEEY